MKTVWNNFKIAFSMYSKIPMPYADWNAENMQYSMCFFPLIGVVIGAIVIGLSYLFPILGLQGNLETVAYLLVPILITGGIHLDGFLDTCDALSSWQPIEKRLEILKDPHTGAFAIISALTYYLIAFGIWSEAQKTGIVILGIGFVLSRSLSGLSVVTFPLAKNTGLAATFSKAAEKKKVKTTMICYLVICSLLMIVWNLGLSIVALITAGLVFVYYRRLCIKQFGGMTGDLAGFFLQICELAMAVTVILAQHFGAASLTIGILSF